MEDWFESICHVAQKNSYAERILGGGFAPLPPPQVTPMFWIYGMYNMCRYVYIHKQQEELQFCMVLDNMWGNVVF